MIDLTSKILGKTGLKAKEAYSHWTDIHRALPVENKMKKAQSAKMNSEWFKELDIKTLSYKVLEENLQGLHFVNAGV